MVSSRPACENGGAWSESRSTVGRCRIRQVGGQSPSPSAGLPRQKHKRLERAADSAEEAVQAVAKLSAALATACRRRGKRVLFRMLETAPPGF
jgi:hypothetical protein